MLERKRKSRLLEIRAQRLQKAWGSWKYVYRSRKELPNTAQRTRTMVRGGELLPSPASTACAAKQFIDDLENCAHYDCVPWIRTVP